MELDAGAMGKKRAGTARPRLSTCWNGFGGKASEWVVFGSYACFTFGSNMRVLVGTGWTGQWCFLKKAMESLLWNYTYPVTSKVHLNCAKTWPKLVIQWTPSFASVDSRDGDNFLSMALSLVMAAILRGNLMIEQVLGQCIHDNVHKMCTQIAAQFAHNIMQIMPLAGFIDRIIVIFCLLVYLYN